MELFDLPTCASTAESRGFPADYVSPKLSSSSQESPDAPSELTPLQPPGESGAGTASEDTAESPAHELEPVEPQVEEIPPEGMHPRVNSIISPGSSRTPSVGSKHRRSVRHSKNVTPDLSEDERRMSGSEDTKRSGRLSNASNSTHPTMQSSEDVSNVSEDERRESAKPNVGSSARVAESKDVTPNLSDNETKSADKEKRKKSKKSNVGSGSTRPKMQSRDTTPSASEDEGKRSGKEQRKPSKKRSKAKQPKTKSRDVTPNLSEDERITSDSEHRTQSGRHSIKSNSRHSRKQSGDATPVLSEDERMRSHAEDMIPSRVAEESDASDSDTEVSRITPVELMEEEPTTLIGRAMEAETLGPWDEAAVGSRELISRISDRHEMIAMREGHGHDTADSQPVRVGAVEDVSPAPMRGTGTPQNVPGQPEVEAGHGTETLGTGGDAQEQEDEREVHAHTASAMERLPEEQSTEMSSSRSAGDSIRRRTYVISGKAMPLHRSKRKPREHAQKKPAGPTRVGSWHSPREHVRKKSEASRYTTRSAPHDHLCVTRQPWGTIVPTSYMLGQQRLPARKITGVVSRLYNHVPTPKELPKLEEQQRHRIMNLKELVNRLSDPRQRPIPDVDRRMEMSINYPKGVLGSYAWNGEPIFLTKLQ